MCLTCFLCTRKAYLELYFELSVCPSIKEGKLSVSRNIFSRFLNPNVTVVNNRSPVIKWFQIIHQCWVIFYTILWKSFVTNVESNACLTVPTVPIRRQTEGREVLGCRGHRILYHTIFSCSLAILSYVVASFAHCCSFHSFLCLDSFCTEIQSFTEQQNDISRLPAARSQQFQLET